jgi:hypothetical protein
LIKAAGGDELQSIGTIDWRPMDDLIFDGQILIYTSDDEFGQWPRPGKWQFITTPVDDTNKPDIRKYWNDKP